MHRTDLDRMRTKCRYMYFTIYMTTWIEMTVEVRMIVVLESVHQGIELSRRIKPRQFSAHFITRWLQFIRIICSQQYITVEIKTFHSAASTVIMNVIWESETVDTMRLGYTSFKPDATCDCSKRVFIWHTPSLQTQLQSCTCFLSLGRKFRFHLPIFARNISTVVDQ